MKRFISYVYIYENGTKGKNVGFIKVELRDTRVQMEIQLRNVGRYQGKVMSYMMLPVDSKGNKEGTKSLGIPLWEMDFRYGTVNSVVEVDAEKIAEGAYNFSQIVGVRMNLDESHYLASCWKENEEAVVMCEKLEIWQQENKIAEDKIKENRVIVGNRSEDKKIPENKVTGENEPKEKAEESKAQVSKYRIDISEIKKFPKKNWYLCNNSFLIHGYFNYKYLMIKKVKEDGKMKYYLGVPGVYDKAERMMAILFGFPEFEKEQSDFGYWYCLLDM